MYEYLHTHFSKQAENALQNKLQQNFNGNKILHGNKKFEAKFMYQIFAKISRENLTKSK